MRGLQPWVVSLVGASLLVLASRSGLACSPPPYDPWFVAHLQIDGAALPPDIVLSGRPPLGIMIQNESASTLQVEVPAGAGRMRRISVEPGGNQTASLAAAATGFVARDDRPDGVQVPPPEHFELRVLHGESAIPVPVVIHYELNHGYRAGMYARGVADCGALYEGMFDADSDAPVVWTEPAKPRNLWFGEASQRRAVVALSVFLAALLVVVRVRRGRAWGPSVSS